MRGAQGTRMGGVREKALRVGATCALLFCLSPAAAPAQGPEQAAPAAVEVPVGAPPEREPAAVAEALMKELSGALQAQLAAGGPVEAVNVCTELAPAIAGRLSRETGWRVTRVGTRVRNPLLGTPDAWEARVLAEFEARAAAGEPLAGMSFAEQVEEPGGRFQRYLRAIPVQPACLACHGPPETLAAPVAEALRARYPHDRATGYLAGQLRGAVSIKQPLD